MLHASRSIPPLLLAILTRSQHTHVLRHITAMADPPLYAALLLIQLNFAIGAVAAALALPKTEPLTFALIREVCAAFLLTAYASKQGEPAAPPRGSRALMSSRSRPSPAAGSSSFALTTWPSAETPLSVRAARVHAILWMSP